MQTCGEGTGDDNSTLVVSRAILYITEQPQRQICTMQQWGSNELNSATRAHITQPQFGFGGGLWGAGCCALRLCNCERYQVRNVLLMPCSHHHIIYTSHNAIRCDVLFGMCDLAFSVNVYNVGQVGTCILAHYTSHHWPLPCIIYDMLSCCIIYDIARLSHKLSTALEPF